jgi:uncharacterized membrane protein
MECGSCTEQCCDLGIDRLGCDSSPPRINLSFNALVRSSLKDDASPFLFLHTKSRIEDMKTKAILTTLLLTGSAATAQDIRFEVLPGIYPLDMSTDGSVIVGNDLNYETVRWTRATGVVNLGRGTFPLGIGAGSPDCSDDGSVISATIINAAGTFGTQGRWTESGGWEDLLQPLPADGGAIDQSFGSAWGISGNGDHVVGLYWRPGNGGPSGDGLAHASMSGLGPTVVDLGSTMRDSRANHANFDGSVVVGWDTSNTFGYWSPTVWENGVLTHLNTNLGWAMANYVTPSGNIIGGEIYNEIFQYSEATMWHRDGSSWSETVLGVLPGTVGPRGISTVRSMTPDGSKVVGFNVFNPTAPATGFIWTAEDGMIDVKDYLADQGIEVPSDMIILDLTAISEDGTIMAGIGVSSLDGITPIGFRISPACPADMNNDFALNFLDVSAFLGAFGDGESTADFNEDGSFNFLDVSEFLSQFGAGCP